jgi:TRAP-type uncharacterized transport system substrate-binding protein
MPSQAAASPNQSHLSHRATLWFIGGGLLLAAALVWGLARLHPLPPQTLTLACGPEGSSYQVFGKRYQALLAKQGIQLRLVTTQGGVENLARLNEPGSGVDLGFVEGGLTAETDEPSLVSLGTIGYAPIWFFSRHIATDRGLFALKGKRVSVGPLGSSSRAVVAELLKRNAMDLTAFKELPLEPEASADALLAGQVDAVVLQNSLASPVVRRLLKSPGVDVANFTRADAYTAIFPSLTKRVLPAGFVDLEHDRPSHDVTLLATKVSLVARGDLHPALQYLMLEVISQVHARSGVFQKAGEFPAAETLEIPLSEEAVHFYKSGRPLLQRYLPFWLAALVEQLVLLLIPVLGLTYPLVKGLMSLYGWGVQRRIFTLYGELHWLESQLDALGKGPVPPELEARMRTLEARARRLRVSSKYIPMVYSLKDTLATVRQQMDARRKPSLKPGRR